MILKFHVSSDCSEVAICLQASVLGHPPGRTLPMPQSSRSGRGRLEETEGSPAAVPASEVL